MASLCPWHIQIQIQDLAFLFTIKNGKIKFLGIKGVYKVLINALIEDYLDQIWIYDGNLDMKELMMSPITHFLFTVLILVVEQVCTTSSYFKVAFAPSSIIRLYDQ